MLRKWFPQMENFGGQLKKYRVTINDLLEENKKLEARAKAGERKKIQEAMGQAKLESELYNLQRLVDRIPPELMQQLRQEMKQKSQER